LKRENISCSLFIDDIQKYIDKEREVANTQNFYGSYHKYEEMVAYANALCTANANKCQWIPSIGKSVQGRDIFLLRLGVTPVTKAKPVIYFQGGQHAREWISPITVMYVVEQLLTSSDPTIQSFLNEAIIDVVIHLNPDGYFYTWQNSNNRLWRKNRKLVAANVYGVDLNRNWADHWGGEGSSGTPSSDTYRGTAPFSEPETKAVLDWISFTQKTLVLIGAIDFHSYSQLILRPYGWTYENSPDEAVLNAMGAGMATAIKESFGKVYVNQKAIGLYPASGTAEDWFYSVGIRFSYTIELRDTGLYGFLLPADQILPTAKEIWNSMIFYIENAIEQSK